MGLLGRVTSRNSLCDRAGKKPPPIPDNLGTWLPRKISLFWKRKEDPQHDARDDFQTLQIHQLHAGIREEGDLTLGVVLHQRQETLLPSSCRRIFSNGRRGFCNLGRVAGLGGRKARETNETFSSSGNHGVSKPQRQPRWNAWPSPKSQHAGNENLLHSQARFLSDHMVAEGCKDLVVVCRVTNDCGELCEKWGLCGAPC